MQTGIPYTLLCTWLPPLLGAFWKQSLTGPCCWLGAHSIPSAPRSCCSTQQAPWRGCPWSWVAMPRSSSSTVPMWTRLSPGPWPPNLGTLDRWVPERFPGLYALQRSYPLPHLLGERALLGSSLHPSCMSSFIGVEWVPSVWDSARLRRYEDKYVVLLPGFEENFLNSRCLLIKSFSSFISLNVVIVIVFLCWAFLYWTGLSISPDTK